jgi:hypothetical protein
MDKDKEGKESYYLFVNGNLPNIGTALPTKSKAC